MSNDYSSKQPYGVGDFLKNNRILINYCTLVILFSLDLFKEKVNWNKWPGKHYSAILVY